MPTLAASAPPDTAPSVAITAASVSSCRAMAPRLAPTARRIDSSRRRATARSSAMIATFTQAMSSTDAGGGEQDRQRELELAELAGAQRLDAERPVRGGVVGRLRLRRSSAGHAREIVARLIEARAAASRATVNR